jgi:hypothetical protein
MSSSDNAPEAGAPDLSLELRLERIKRLGNLRLNFLKLIYDRRPIGEQYCSGEVCLHVHFGAIQGYCATYRAGHVPEIVEMESVHDMNSEFMLSGSRDKGPVLVGIGHVSKDGSPLASSVRLQCLDSCDMRGIEAIEPSTINPRFEALALTFNRKLASFDVESGVEARKFKGQVIEGRSQIVDNLANQDAKSMIERDLASFYQNLLRFIRVRLD